MLSTLSIILFLSVTITVVSYFLVSDNLEQTLTQTSEKRLSFLCSSIDANIGSVNSFIRSCQINSKVSKYAMDNNKDSNVNRREAKDYISEIYTSNAALPSQIIRLVIWGNCRNDIIQIVESPYSSGTVSQDVIKALPYYKVLKNSLEQVTTGIISDPFITTKKVPMIPMLHAIQHPYRAYSIGYIYTEISPAVIIKPVETYLAENDCHFFFDIGSYKYEYLNGSLEKNTKQYDILEDLSKNALDEYTSIHKVLDKETKKSSIMISRPLNSEKDWRVTVCLDEIDLQNKINSTFLMIVAIILSSASLIAVLLSWFLNHTVNVPVKKLQNRMLCIANGDFTRDSSIEWNHELGEIGRNINDLSENVLTLMNQKLEDERQKKDYEYRMLQSQINPHFLYNTLNSIKWMATIQNAPGIAEMTTTLSRLLKDISKGTTNVVSIEHELSLIKDYFTIQQYKYGGTITLNTTIDNDALIACKILKFTLQPIVENAIFHGIEPKGSAGTITIHIYETYDTNVQIDITDNGIGMKEDFASQLLKKENPMDSSFFQEIGIYNVHRRLQYEFGEQYGLSIKSVYREFTTISILLPHRI